MEKNNKTNYDVWEKLILSWKESGLTRKGFCEKNNVKVTTFDYYRKKIVSQRETGFIEVTVPVAEGYEPIHIRVREALVIEVRNGFDPGLLSNILKVVENPPCS